MAPTSAIVDSNGAPVSLGKRLGGGAEGDVFLVSSKPGFAAKIFKSVAPQRVDKVRAMVANHPKSILGFTAWPTEILLSRDTRQPVGMLMPVSPGKDIHMLYSPKSRRSEFVSAGWPFLVRAAINTARAFAAVHSAGYVIGDVNHGSVLVADDATVRLIDCDSFQVVVGSRQYLCEVAVETFTPPELQNGKFRGALRTPNHDCFSLAVMIFLLLFVGRHPFSGRYRGGDMPIPKAIAEFRFAYGASRSQLGMDQPPGTPPLGMVGVRVAGLFEAAFGPGGLATGRPSAEVWVGALGELDQHLVRCTNSPAHSHRKDVACPWCVMEAATGLMLFPLPAVAQSAVFDIAAFWRQVEAVKHPGSAPLPQSFSVPPSAEATEIGRNDIRRNGIGAAVALCLVLLSFFGGYGFAFAGAVAFIVIRRLMNRDADIARLRDRLTHARTIWSSGVEQWQRSTGTSEFEARRAEIDSLKKEWDRVPMVRAQKLDQLRRDQRTRQLLHFLDNFKIDAATIQGIGPARKQTLESYGIETAADITRGALAVVPGIGPKYQARLLDWRDRCERKFLFNPAQPLDQGDVAQVEQEVLKMKLGLESKMKATLAELNQVVARLRVARSRYNDLAAARNGLDHAEADLRAVER